MSLIHCLGCGKMVDSINDIKLCVACAKKMAKKICEPPYISSMEDLDNLDTIGDYGDCNLCSNFIDSLFKNPNCSGCSKNPFYINCFSPKVK